MEINEFCESCIYDRIYCKLTPLSQTTSGGRLYCPGKRSIYESSKKRTDTCDICGQKFTNDDYISQENVVWEIRHPLNYNTIEELRVFNFDVHKQCLTKENQEMLSRKVFSIILESTTK